MIVTRECFPLVLGLLCKERKLALDTETTGLRPWHGDRLFSLIIANATQAYYFNFQAYEGLPSEQVLPESSIGELQALFGMPEIRWYFHNAKYDLAILAQEGLTIAGEIHCCLALGRVEYNEHFKYDLDVQLKRIGLAKDDRVEEYIKEHGLSEKREVLGKHTKETVKFFNKVPFPIISEYGLADGRGTYILGAHQEASIADQTKRIHTGRLRTLSDIAQNERRLTKTVFRMEQVGVRIDREYTLRAARYEADRADKASQAFKKETARDYLASPKLFAEIFASEKDKWELTEKGNPSFESEVLRKFLHPAAQLILTLRDAKSKADFYNGFLYHADGKGDVHPNYNPHGAAHGRFSSSNPNFQNLTSEDIGRCRACGAGTECLVDSCKCGSRDLEWFEFLTRRAIIPRPGYVFIMPDYDQMEYRMMFDLACYLVVHKYSSPEYQGESHKVLDFYGITEEGSAIVREIKAGKDPHQATADLVTGRGTTLTRSRAKNGNFALLYGSGDRKLAETIGGTLSDAKALRSSIYGVAPELPFFLKTVTGAAEKNGYITNWAGRICQFPNRDFAYRSTNYYIAGGCADVVKIAMNRIDETQEKLKCRSRMVMMVHDELPCEVHERELHWYPKRVHEIMEGVYPYKFLPLTCGMEWSSKSLADKKKGFPV